MKELIVTIDLQFGSTGKGLLSAGLARNQGPDVVVAAWGPNSGHTVVDNGMVPMRWVRTQLPVSANYPTTKVAMIGPGAIVDCESLLKEIEMARASNPNLVVKIHPHAAYIRPKDVQQEQKALVGIGSTMKGTSIAVTRKMMRKRGDEGVIGMSTFVESQFVEIGGFIVSHDEYVDTLLDADTVLVEGCQGYSLGINSGFYPFVTSRECTVYQYLVDCGIPRVPSKIIQVYGAMRTFPIRVANRYDDHGNQIGYSGPGCPDQREIEWADIGVEPELTTVTKLPRRVFTFSETQIRHALIANGNMEGLFINFLNYIEDPEDQRAFVHRVESIVEEMLTKGALDKWPVFLGGFGPSVAEVREV